MSDLEVALALRLFEKSILKQAKFRALDRMIGPVAADAQCLDLGSDNGVISYLLRQRGGRWSSADLSDRAVAAIRSLVGTNVHKTDGLSLPFADAALDLVVIVDMLEHVRDEAGCLREMHRVLRPGGTLIVNTPHAKPHSLVRALRERIGLTDEWHGHVRPGYTRASLSERFDGSFTVEASESYSKVFSELLDTGLNYAYLRQNGAGSEDRAKGTVVTTEDLQKRAKQFRTLARVYPLLRVWASLDRLCVGARGYYLIVRARRT